jgi:hypothetical protein
MDIIDLVIVFVAAFWLGWKVQEKIMFYTMAEMFRKAGITNKELDKFINHWKDDLDEPEEVEVDENGYEIVPIKIEQHGEVLYAFRKDDDQFLGQGDSKESLIRRLGEKLVGIRLVIEEGDGAELIGGSFNVSEKGEITQAK